jgi:aryl-alcohol dehydrogenase-like predicted oxidoreductase
MQVLRNNQLLILFAARSMHTARETRMSTSVGNCLGQSKDVVPIPGTKRRQYLDENLGAVEVQLKAVILADLSPLAAIVSGERYSAHAAKLAER